MIYCSGAILLEGKLYTCAVFSLKMCFSYDESGILKSVEFEWPGKCHVFRICVI